MTTLSISNPIVLLLFGVLPVINAPLAEIDELKKLPVVFIASVIWVKGVAGGNEPALK